MINLNIKTVFGWFNVKYFFENKYFSEMLFSKKKNIFKYLIAL